MRRRLIIAIVAVAAGTLALFALPLAVVLRDGYRDLELLRLQRDTVGAARQIDVGAGARDPVELPTGPDRFTAYDASGRRVAGRPSAGPARADALVIDAIGRRRPTTRTRSGTLVAAVPLLTGEQVTGALRAQRSDGIVVARTHRAWRALAAAAAGVLLLATLAAVLLGRRLARPLERVASAARRLGDGDFSTRAPRSPIREVDAVADALDVTAERLDDLVTRERAFSADASHQLRTPLAALRLELEALELDDPTSAAAKRAVDQVDRLQQTIETLLRVARDIPRSDSRCDLVELLGQTEQRWHGRLADAGRRLTLTAPAGRVTVQAGRGVITEILDVLLDNALHHGQGTVSIVVRDIDERWAEVVVGDEGPGFTGGGDSPFDRRTSGASGHGIGLALARSLAHAEGGRLTVSHAGPSPRLSLVLGRP